MNLFILSLDPAKIAEYMMDKHIAKIILEAVQMLCTTQRLLTAAAGIECDPCVYKIVHKNHPSRFGVVLHKPTSYGHSTSSTQCTRNGNTDTDIQRTNSTNHTALLNTYAATFHHHTLLKRLVFQE